MLFYIDRRSVNMIYYSTNHSPRTLAGKGARAMVRIVKKAEVRRQEIVKAARQLFQTGEYEKTTMQELMDKLVSPKAPFTIISNPRRNCWRRWSRTSWPRTWPANRS